MRWYWSQPRRTRSCAAKWPCSPSNNHSATLSCDAMSSDAVRWDGWYMNAPITASVRCHGGDQSICSRQRRETQLVSLLAAVCRSSRSRIGRRSEARARARDQADNRRRRARGRAAPHGDWPRYGVISFSDDVAERPRAPVIKTNRWHQRTAAAVKT